MRYISEVHWERGGRRVNEDSVSLQEVRMQGKTALLVLVCDGIGGLCDGENASGFVAERVTEWFYKEALVMLEKKKRTKKIIKAGLRALYECNEELERQADKTKRKTGTTATIMLLFGAKYLLWHVGDTRGYRIRKILFGQRKKTGNVKMRRLTEDHTAYENALLRCIGSFKWQGADVEKGYIRKGETILLCSDGFRNRIEEKRLGEALQMGEVYTKDDLQRRLREIAEYVKQKGENDNISAIAVKRV